MADLPEGYKDIPEEDRKKAKVFFDRAKTVADTGNYEYAIEMYIQGLNYDPDSIEAHDAMRAVSLKRKATGGKPMGTSAQWGLKKGDDKQNMLNSEKKLAYDPGNQDHMLATAQAAQKGGFYDTVMWAGQMLFRAIRELPEKKQSVQKLTSLKDVFRGIQEYKSALDVLAVIIKLRPGDMDLSQELKDLGARETMKKGNYEAGDFRKSMRDKEGQERLMRLDTDVRTLDMMGQAIAEAEAAYQANPADPSLLSKYVDILVKTEQPEYENKAIEALDQRYRETRQYRFKQRIGQITITQLGRMERSLREEVNRSPNDPELRKSYNQFLRDRAEQELSLFRETVENYPTDSPARFEMGKRLFLLQRFDEAIPVFQQSRTDPKYKALSTVLLGRSFLEAQFFDEAVDTLQAAIAEYPLKGDEKSIDMTYWYARSLEQKGDLQSALKSYSQTAQWNFNYRDVQQRIKRLRAAANPNQGQPAAPGAPTV